MQAFLLCNDELTASKVRTILVRESVDCPASNVIPIDDATRRLSKGPSGLVVAILPNDPPECLRVLDILGALPRQDQTRVIAIGPAADPKLVIRALRGIVDDYMDIDDLEHELVAALAGMKARQPERLSEGRLISVLSAGGGSGSSTLASSIATTLAKEHKTVGLIDLKLDSGDLASLLNLKPTYTLADLCQNIERMDRVFFEQALVKHASGVHLLAPPRQIIDVAMVTPEGIRRALAISREMFPYVVVDLGHGFGEEEVGILRKSDAVVVVMRLDFTSMMNARRILEHLEFLSIPSDRIRLVVNRHGQPKEVPAAKAEDALGVKVFHYVPDEPKVVNRANNNGVPVVIDAPSSKVSKSITKLAMSLNGQHAAH